MAAAAQDPIAQLWRLGDISYLLHRGQEEIRDRFEAATARRFVVCCSRRFGKSYLCCTLAIEAALRKPNAQIRYAAPTAKMVRSIIEPLMRQILDDCPRWLRPSHHRQEGVWRFPNGSEIHVAGCDNGNAERLRGTSTDLGIVDEAGFVDELEYVVQDVLLPQTITTDGRLLLVSTPPRSPAHDFVRYCTEADAAGAYEHRTIYDAPHLTPAQIEEYERESGGAESSTWRREYLAQVVVDTSWAIVPEWTDAEQYVVGEVERPLFFHAYVGMDVGYSDLTVALLGYYHWGLARLVVEGEVVKQRAPSGEIDAAVAELERELWGDHEVRRRVVDAPAIVVADLRRFHGRSWSEARKDDAEAALNALREDVRRHRILVHPRCRTLIAHLRYGIWNKSRTSFDRSDADGLGHFDAIDALKYLLRHVDRHDNPFPADFGLGASEGRMPLRRHQTLTETDRALVAMLRPPRRK